MWGWWRKPKCECCSNKAVTIKFINGKKYNLCEECKDYYDNIKIEITE